MSFSGAIDGLVFDWDRAGRTTLFIPRLMDSFAPEPFYFECIYDYGEEIGIIEHSCPRMRTTTTSVSYAVTDMPWGRGADYYYLSLIMFGPRLLGVRPLCNPGVDGDPPPPGAQICVGDFVPPVYDGEFDGTWRRPGVEGYIDPTFESHMVGTIATSEAQWPESPLGYRINPSPVWVVPDGDGNEFGEALFTEAEMEALTIDVVFHAYHHSDNGGAINVRIGAYNIGETPPAAIRNMYVTGHV